MLDERMPPHDTSAEEAVLGSLLIDPEQMEGLELESEDFLTPKNKIIFEAMLKLGLSIDQITVAAQLKASGCLTEAGGAAYLSHVVNQTPTSLNCHHYAGIVKRLSIHRKLIATAGNIAQIGYDSGDVEESLVAAETLLNNVKRSHGKAKTISPKERAESMLDRYTNLQSDYEKIAVPIGLVDVDREIGGGLFPGELMVIGAATGMGKSTVAQNIANRTGQKLGSVLFCSAEMTPGSLTDRDVSSITGLDVNVIRRGGYDIGTMSIIMDALGKISESQVHIFDRIPLTVPSITLAAESLKNREDLRLVVVDYLQLLETRGKDKRYQEVGDIVYGLATTAKKLEVPFIVLSQLKRDFEARENKRPRITDLYESGKIEQAADVILFLHREAFWTSETEWNANFAKRADWQHVYSRGSRVNPGYPKNIAEINIAKRRQGGHDSGPAIKKVVWYAQSGTYRDLEKN